jgi:hypothetical protein
MMMTIMMRKIARGIRIKRVMVVMETRNLRVIT